MHIPAQKLMYVVGQHLVKYCHMHHAARSLSDSQVFGHRQCRPHSQLRGAAEGGGQDGHTGGCRATHCFLVGFASNCRTQQVCSHVCRTMQKVMLINDCSGHVGRQAKVVLANVPSCMSLQHRLHLPRCSASVASRAPLLPLPLPHDYRCPLRWR
jgi:hypothetical protein